MAQVLEARNGRKLSVESIGAPDGRPVFLMHGTPGGRKGPRPRGIFFHRLGIRLISYDRPGYAASSRQENRTVADAADDVKFIAKELRIDRFGVVGRSGGGPHALACAALLPEMVDRAAALSSLAPIDASGLEWFEGMAQSNVDAYSDTDEGLRARLDKQAAGVRSDPESLLNFLWPELVKADQKLIGDIALRRIIAEVHADAVRNGAQGWIDDAIALRSPWKFEVDNIIAPVRLWHGKDDRFSPPSHTQWLGERIKDCSLIVRAGTAHFGSIEILPDVLKWAAGVDDQQYSDWPQQVPAGSVH